MGPPRAGAEEDAGTREMNRPNATALAAPAALGLALLALASAALAEEPAPPKRHAAVARLEGKLAIDGKLDEPAWQKAPVHTGFEMPLGEANRTPIPEEAQTSFRVLVDDAALYFGIRCNEPKMSDLVAQAARVHDAAMWSDDDVELFLDPVGDRMEYYQLTVNTDATQVDLYYIERGNTGKGGWSSEWQAAVDKGKDYWSVEIAIPFGLFHNRPSRMWADEWAFSISRTRNPAPRYFSQFSPASKYHDVANFGTLGPIKVDRSRFNLYAESPQFRLEPAAGYNRVTGSLKLENRGEAPFEGTLAMELLAPRAKGACVDVKLAAGGSDRIELPDAFVHQQGKWPVVFHAQGPGGYAAMVARFDEWLTFTPLTLKLTQPNYRNCIFATQDIKAVRGFATIALPPGQVLGFQLKVTLSSSVMPPVSVEAKIEKEKMAFELPAGDLREGRYTVRAEILRPIPKPKPDGPKSEIVAEAEAPLRKLPSAPAVEARVDDQGNLLIHASPVFVRGWYGSLGYCVGPSSFPQAQLPHSTNFIMGAGEREQADLGLYTLAGVTREIDEAKAKLDQPIDDALKAKLRAAMAAARLQRNVIGYYISDEPECRGLSPVFLKSLYEFMAEEDPYRFCKIVSRAPDVYIGACDVMCPHPYMNPLRLDDGTRRFGTFLRHVHNEIATAVAANDGSKAIWSMPQTFSYGGKQGDHPTFRESRWFVHTSIACGAKGVVPFIFNGYWNHLESRIAMTCVFEELAFLAPAWIERDTAAEAVCDSPDVDVIAKFHRPKGAAHGHAFVVAANQSYEPSKATITVPALAKNRNARLLVLRENRVVAVEGGKFSDQFDGLGAHVYTTLEVVPHLKTLDAIEREIAEALARPKREGNLLAAGEVRWAAGEFGRAFGSDAELIDGARDAAGWFPVYDDRTQCVIVFEKPVTFSRVEMDTSTIRSADLDVWADGQWKTIHQWKDQFLYHLAWKGDAVTTTKLRIRPTEARTGYGSWLIHEITELGIYR